MFGDSFLDDSAFIGINNNHQSVQKVDTNKKILNKSKVTQLSAHKEEPELPPTQFTDGKPYRHQVPEKYSPGNAFKRDWEKIPNDKLMFDLIQNYAKEGKDKSNGKPDGRYYLDHAAVVKVSKPYIDKYLAEDKQNKKDYALYMKMDFETIF